HFFYASFCRIGRFRFGCLKRQGLGDARFFAEILPAGLEISAENRRLDLAFPSNPGITFAPRTEMTA
ncbi:hypothetical protein, partial [uncultured Duncaniella sp.]|uniref:hypothetical protein n=1 Tax=uncultured Duncaniella sp. TaxID=2768039 RepID=UPI0026761424